MSVSAEPQVQGSMHACSIAHEQLALAPGNLVEVKQYGRAYVVEAAKDGKCLVRYEEDGKQYLCNIKRLRKLCPSAHRVVVCKKTAQFREMSVHNVKSKDVCLEVGSSWGVTTAFLHNRCTYIVGIDHSEFAVEQARQRVPHVRFEVADAFDIPALRPLSPSQTFDTILVDISGKAPLVLIGRLIHLYLAEFPESQILVKNEALYKHLERRAVERSAAAAEQRRQDAGQWWWEHHLQKRAHEHQEQWQGAEPEEVEQLVAELDQHCELFRPAQ